MSRPQEMRMAFTAAVAVKIIPGSPQPAQRRAAITEAFPGDYNEKYRRTLFAVVRLMDTHWSDVTFAALLGNDPAEKDFEAVDRDYLRNMVAFYWALEGRSIFRQDLAAEVVGQLNHFPFSIEHLISLVELFEYNHGPIWKPEVRDVDAD